jgi:ferredoxin-NADP reductase
MEYAMIEGPYGEAKEYMPPLLESSEAAGKILCIAGGIGATYTIPIYLSFLRKRQSTAGVYFVWFVHSVQDAAWGIPLVNAAKCDVDVRIYLTRDMDKSLLVSGKAGLGELKPGIKILNYGKRPPMKDIMDRYFAPATTVAGAMLTTGTRGKDYTPVTVLCCGPPTLMDAVRTEVGKHVYEYGRDVTMYEERFGHGAALEADVIEETFRQKGLRKVLQAQSL